MTGLFHNLYRHRELFLILAWKNIAIRYKQSYLGVFWVVIKPLCLMLIFSLVRGFIGINSGPLPYSVLVFTALIPWGFFQESASEGVVSVTGNTALIRKIYFPREIFPLIAVVTKLVGVVVNLGMLLLLMAWFDLFPGWQALWVPLLALYACVPALTVALFGAAVNVYYRDVGQALPVMLSLMLYVSPIMYPLHLVQQKLLVEEAAGAWSGLLYQSYLLNPMAGLIDSFQNVLLRDLPPDPRTLLPAALLLLLLLPLSYLYFKRAERRFADVI